eukprot:2438353-Ditylum_brightwellii.AAC.1
MPENAQNGKLHPKRSNRDKERREVYMYQIRAMCKKELKMQQQDRHIFKKSLEQWEQSSTLAMVEINTQIKKEKGRQTSGGYVKTGHKLKNKTQHTVLQNWGVEWTSRRNTSKGRRTEPRE